MAQFTTHSRVKLLLNGDGLPFGSESKDRLRHDLRSVRTTLKRGIPLSRALRKSAHQQQQQQHAAELRVGVRGESVTGGDAIVDLEYDYEFETDDLACFRGLVLDISYRPVNVVCWKRAICLEFMEKADVLEYYDQTVSSPSGSFYIPAVLRVPHLLQVVKRRRITNSLSRKNILYRDNYTCQYCSSHESLTIDHVLPISRGGEWTWENLVAACVNCNSKKGQKTVEEANMKLKKTPKPPKEYDILAIPLTSTAIRMLKLRKGTPEEWRQYLSSEQ